MNRTATIRHWVTGLLIGLLSLGQLLYAQTPTVDLTAHQSSATPPASTTLEWHNALPVSAANLITGAQSTSAAPGVYYAVYNYGGSPVCYSQPSYLRVLTNTCPTTTVDLRTGVDPASTPASATLTFHSSATASAATELSSSTVTASATETTYYVAYKTYDASTSSYCYSGTSPIVVVLTTCYLNCSANIAPVLSASGKLNSCPAITVDLSGITASNLQPGTTLTWHSGTPASAANELASVAAVSGGTYYAAFKGLDGGNVCYGPTTAVGAVVSDCSSPLPPLPPVPTTCDYTALATVTLAISSEPASMSHTYLLVDMANGKIVQVSPTAPTFANVDAGNYFAIAAYYTGTLSNATPGKFLIDVFAGDAGACLKYSAPYAFKVCGSCDFGTVPATIAFTATPSSTSGVTTTYLLIDENTNQIAKISSTASFPGLSEGYYAVVAVYTAGSSTLAVGDTFYNKIANNPYCLGVSNAVHYRVCSLTNCSANVAPVLSASGKLNSCPAITVDLSGITASNTPVGTTLTWHSGTPASAANELASVAAVSGGTYYVAFKGLDGSNVCYGPTTAVQAMVSDCGSPLPPLPPVPIACDYNESATVTLAISSEPASMSHTYLLVDMANGKIVQVNPTAPTFTSVAAGNYFAVAAYYTGTLMDATVGKFLIDVYEPLSGCLTYSDPLPFKVCGSCDVITSPTTLTLTATPSSATGITTTYVLIDEATNTIARLSSTPSFAGVTTGSYAAVALYTASSSTLAVGDIFYNKIATDPYCLGVSNTVHYQVCTITCSASVAPALSATSKFNSCPAITVDLSSITASNTPAGAPLTWHTGTPATAANEITAINSLTAGTYYAAFQGVDSGTVCYGPTTSVVASVTVCPKPPLLTPDIAVTGMNTPVTGNVLTNDLDPQGGPLTVSLLTSPMAGTVTLSPTGSYTYTPPRGFTGVVSFCYSATNSAGLSASVCGSITVNPVPTPNPDINNRPIANNDATQTTAGVSVTVNVAANDTDPDSATSANGQLDVPTLVSQPASGTASIVNGRVVYTPPANFTGVVSFPYQICDKASPALCTTALVTVNVLPTPPASTTLAPVAVDDALITQMNVPKTGTVAANDSDPQGLPLTYTTGQPVSGTVVMSSTGSYTYTPPAGFVGPTSFTYTVCNSANKCDVATVSVLVQPIVLPPLAASDINNTNVNTPVSGNVLTNDVDPQGGPLTASLLSQPQSGTVSLNLDGSYTYTPPTGFTGVVSFCYSVTNTVALNASACVSITVNPLLLVSANNRPIANDDNTQTTAGVSVTVNVAANDSDPDSATSANGQLKPPVLVSQPRAGTASVVNGVVVYTPPANFTGVVSFPYRLCDNATTPLCATALVTVNVLPTPPVNTTLAPVAVDDALLTQVNISKTGTVAANDSDPQGLPLTYTTGQPASGTVVMSSTGSYTYTPPVGFVGPTSFTYTVCNSANKCDVATVSVLVQTSCLLPALEFTDINAYDPITCGGSDGYILVTSLPISVSVSVSYQKNGTAQQYTGVSDTNGTLLIPNLGTGIYSQFVYQTGVCISSPYTDTVAIGSGPTLPALGAANFVKTNPSACGTATGSVLVSGLTPSQSYTITFSKNSGLPQQVAITTDASGQASLSTLTNGTYTGFTYQQNATCLSAPSSATLVLADPAGPTLTASQVVGNNPTACGTSTGSISLSGLTASTSYTVTYTKNGSAPQTVVATSSAGGIVSLTGLSQGSYQVTSLGTSNCTSALSLSAITLADPAGPTLAQNQIIANNPTLCTGSNGSLSLTGLSASTSYSLTYSKNGGAAQMVLLTSTAGGVISLTGLTEGSYLLSTLGAGNCSSSLSLSAVTLTDPGATSLTAANVIPANPATCGASTGSISVTGLTASASYTLSYVQNGGSPFVVTLTSNASGVISVTGLPTGTYTSLILTNSALCTSLPFTGTLVLSDVSLPTPTTATLAGTNLSCSGGNDGQLTMTGLAAGQVYIFHYQINGQSKAIAVTATASGQISVTGLSAGSYSQFFISQSICKSGLMAGPISLTTTCSPNCPVLTFDDINAFDPTACGLSDGYILVTGLPLSTSTTINYQKDGVAQTYAGSSDSNGTLLIPNLGQGRYSRFSYLTPACSSPVYAGTVVVGSGIPPAPLAAARFDKTNPVSCGSATGQISLSGLSATTSYTISYSKDGGAIQTTIVTTNASGVASITGLTQGTYTGFAYAGQAGCLSAPSSAILALTDPLSPTLAQGQLTGSNPTACGTSTGSISLSGLTASTSYTVVYTTNGGTPQTAVLTSSASGVVSLTGLGQGSYQVITLGTNNCSGALSLSAITLTDPAGPSLAQTQLSGINPATCGASTGSISLSGLTASTSYTVIYAKNGGTPQTVVLASNASGVVSLTGLGQGSYLLTGLGTNNCSGALSVSAVILSDPASPTLTASNLIPVNPASCGSATGSFSLTGLVANATYTLSYQKDGGVAQTVNLTANASGVVSLTGLTTGSYGNFLLTNSAGCTSAPFVGPISLSNPALPTPTAITLTRVHAGCLGNDGKLILSGLVAGQTYIFHYQLAGLAKAVSATANTSGVLSVTGLLPGVYSNFFISQANCKSGTFAGPISLTAICEPPVVTPDIANTNINTPVSGNVLTNDVDPLGGTLIASLISQPTAGTVTMSPTGSYTYTPPTGFTGVASFCYSATNSAGLSASTCVTINVNPKPVVQPGTNNPPIANNDATQTTAGVSVTVNVAANDTDPDSATSANGQLDVPTLVSQPASGTASIVNGQVVYTPPVNFTGVVSFPYRICDKASPALCTTALVTVSVQPTPPASTTLAPVAVDDALVTTLNTSKVGTVAANDSDPQGLPLTFTTGQPSSGTVVMSSTGSYTYTPAGGYVGPDSFTYVVCNSANKCDVATVSVLVQGSNGLPLQPKAWLQGALFGVTDANGIMRDDLRSNGYLPLSSPYTSFTALTITPALSSSAVFAKTGNDAIVDWVFVELRSPTSSSTVVDSRAAFIQRDGDIVELDGVSPMVFSKVSPGNYYVSVRHRNHLGTMTATAIPLSITGTVVDFRIADPTLYYRATTSAVNQAQVTVAQGVALWAGNVLYDEAVTYQSTSNDVAAISVQIKTARKPDGTLFNVTKTANYKLKGYYTGDVNMDGNTIYQGQFNDSNHIFLNVTKNHKGNLIGSNIFIIREQLP